MILGKMFYIFKVMIFIGSEIEVCRTSDGEKPRENVEPKMYLHSCVLEYKR